MDHVKSQVSPIASNKIVMERPAGTGKIKGLPPEMRPRERLLSKGCSSLTDSELLAIILRTGAKGLSALDIAEVLLQRYGTLRDLIKVGPQELQELGIPTLKGVKAAEVSAALEIARRATVERRDIRQEPLNNPETVSNLLRPLLTEAEKEYFIVMPLDRKNKLKGRPVEVSVGTADSSLVHPREVFSVCVRLTAVSLIVAHNHPSGDPRPSKEDLDVTKQLIDSGRILGIPLLDHIVIGDPSVFPPGYVSLRAEGLLSFV